MRRGTKNNAKLKHYVQASTIRPALPEINEFNAKLNRKCTTPLKMTVWLNKQIRVARNIDARVIATVIPRTCAWLFTRRKSHERNGQFRECTKHVSRDPGSDGGHGAAGRAGRDRHREGISNLASVNRQFDTWTNTSNTCGKHGMSLDTTFGCPNEAKVWPRSQTRT